MSCGHSHKGLISVAEARKLLMENLPASQVERMPLTQALGKVLAQDVISKLAVPRFDNSAMDGYAVLAADTTEAEGNDPVGLSVKTLILAGQGGERPCLSGEAHQIMTGAPLPPGADSVIEQEKTSRKNGQVYVSAPVQMGKHIRRKGEVIHEGEVALAAGMRMNPAALGWLTECGLEEVQVFKKPSLGLLTTGNELVNHPEKLLAGSIMDSNTPTLCAAFESIGVVPEWVQTAKDDLEDLTVRVREAFQTVQILVLTGGVSVGIKDLVPEVLANEGFTTIFHGVDQKPGKPMLLARRGDCLAIGLPGNPAAGLLGFYLYLRPALRKMMGHSVQQTLKTARLSETYKKNDGRAHFVRVELQEDLAGLLAIPLKGQGSHVLKSFAMAEALALVEGPAGSYPPGHPVQIVPIEEEVR